MKMAIYIEDGAVQLVLTPESEFEKSAMSTFYDKPLAAKIFQGAFYDCRGGWVRQKDYYAPMGGYASDRSDRSLMLRVDTKAPAGGEVQ